MNTFRSPLGAGRFLLLMMAVTGTTFGQDANPNRATTGNNDPTRGVKGENLQPATSRSPANPANEATQWEANPNRATSGNTDATRGVKGENLMPANSAVPGRLSYTSLYLPSTSTFSPSIGCQPVALPPVGVSERDRTHQIYLQILGYGSFNNADVRRRLNLTDVQRQTFQQFDREWTRRMASSNSQYIAGNGSASDEFEDYQRAFQANVAATLTPEQLDQWQALIGRPFGL